MAERSAAQTADERSPTSSSSSDDQAVGAAVQEDAEPASASEEASCAPTDANFDEIKRNPSAEVLAKGISSIMGPVMNNFDAGVEGALKSQSVLASSIDRLTRKLDKLLEDVPLPFATQHATKLSGIHKRVLSLNTSLRIIQKRIDNIERLLAGYVSPAASKGKQVKAMEGCHLTSHGSSLMEVPLVEALSFLSADDHGDDHVLAQLFSENQHTENMKVPENIRSGGLHDDHVQDESVLGNRHIEAANQDAIDVPKPGGSQNATRDEESGGLQIKGN